MEQMVIPHNISTIAINLFFLYSGLIVNSTLLKTLYTMRPNKPPYMIACLILLGLELEIANASEIQDRNA